MKEGYLQIKIAQLNEKCKEIDHMISMEKSKLLLLQEQLGGFKELLKKLKNIDKFKENITSSLNIENEKILKNHIEKNSEKNSIIINDLIKNKTKKIDEIFKYIDKQKNEINIYLDVINQQKKDIHYLIEHNDLLMMKFANKGILTQREIDEMHRRAIKKIQIK